jgi:hypothetical protein
MMARADEPPHEPRPLAITGELVQGGQLLALHVTPGKF